MFVCMFVCIYVYTYIHTNIHMPVYAVYRSDIEGGGATGSVCGPCWHSLPRSPWSLSLCLCVCVRVYDVYIYIYICICVCVCVCVQCVCVLLPVFGTAYACMGQQEETTRVRWHGCIYGTARVCMYVCVGPHECVRVYVWDRKSVYVCVGPQGREC
jgi:hypothetical protein